MPSYSYQVRIPFRSGGAFPAGTVIDHWEFFYFSGPTTLPTVTMAAGAQYLEYDNVVQGAYVVTAQAYDATGGTIGTVFTINFQAGPPALGLFAYVPTALKFVGNPGGLGSGQVTAQLLPQILGLTAGTGYDHTTITLTGPSVTSATVSAGALTAQFTGLANGNYNYSIQNFDSFGTLIVPISASPPGGIAYFDEALATTPLMIPNSPAIAIQSSSSGSIPTP